MSTSTATCRLARRADQQGARPPVRQQAGVVKSTTATRNNRPRNSVKSASPLKLAFSNVRGFRSNFLSIQSYLFHNSPDIFALSESNLNSEVSSSDFCVDGYLSLQRKDSKFHMHGLAVYIRNNLPIARECRLESPDESFMCYRVALLHSTTYLFFLYRSPSSQDCSLIDLVSDRIDQALLDCPSANILVFGDFNAHHSTWLNSGHTDASGNHIFDFALSQSLSQIITFPTRYPDHDNHAPSLLDLCLVSDPSICTASSEAPLGNSDHVVISVSVSLNSAPLAESPTHRTSYKYEQGDWNSFRDLLRDAPWSHVFSLPANKCASEVISWIQAGIEAFVPHRRYQVKPHSSPWFSPGCASAIAHRNHYFHLYQRNKSVENRRLFTSARNQCKRVLNEAKSQYMNLTQSRISSQKLGSRDFWKIYNSVFSKGRSNIPPLFHGYEVLSSSKDKAELFARQFSNNCSLDSTGHNLSDFPSRTDVPLHTLRITPKSVAKVIASLDSSKASGPDNIPVIVMQKCSPELSSILSKLFNKCMRESCFPDCWKTASVIPVFKNNGERSDPQNYRPISLLSVISKIFESLINSALVSHFESLGLFSDKQYGFRASRSTADLLTVITERFYRALDKGGEARAIALDISKAFDKVWHTGLLCKLKSYGISGHIYQIIESFLSDRKIKVVLDGQCSSVYSITSGVPQGSILGPILFLLFINDLPDEMMSELAMFADDTSLYSTVSEKTCFFDRLELASSLESDLRSATDWGKQWLVTFNSSKTKLLSINRYRNPDNISISMSGNTLTESTSFRLLGLTFSKDLTWNEYIRSIAKSAAMKVGSLYRARQFLSSECILYLYKALIRPCMEYCCHVWAGSSSNVLSLLDKVQRRICNIIGPDLAIKLQPLCHRRNVASLSLFYKYYHGRCSDEISSLVPPPKIAKRNTRLSTRSHPFTVSVPLCKKAFYSNSFFPRTSVLWNSLPSYCFPDVYNLNVFKSRVNRFLLFNKS